MSRWITVWLSESDGPPTRDTKKLAGFVFNAPPNAVLEEMQNDPYKYPIKDAVPDWRTPTEFALEPSTKTEIDEWHESVKSKKVCGLMLVFDPTGDGDPFACRFVDPRSQTLIERWRARSPF